MSAKTMAAPIKSAFLFFARPGGSAESKSLSDDDGTGAGGLGGVAGGPGGAGAAAATGGGGMLGAPGGRGGGGIGGGGKGAPPPASPAGTSTGCRLLGGPSGALALESATAGAVAGMDGIAEGIGSGAPPSEGATPTVSSSSSTTTLPSCFTTIRVLQTRHLILTFGRPSTRSSERTYFLPHWPQANFIVGRLHEAARRSASLRTSGARSHFFLHDS